MNRYLYPTYQRPVKFTDPFHEGSVWTINEKGLEARPISNFEIPDTITLISLASPQPNFQSQFKHWNTSTGVKWQEESIKLYYNHE